MASNPDPGAGRAPAIDPTRKTVSTRIARHSLDWVRRDAHDDPQAVPFVAGMAVQTGLHALALLRAATRDRRRDDGGFAPGY